MLIHLLVFLVIIALIGALYFVIVSVWTKRPISHVFAEFRYELFYNVIGAKAVIEDFLTRNDNKVGKEILDKSGKIAVITGGTRGIGKEVIRMLMKCDMHVIMGCRNVLKGEEILNEFRKDGLATGKLSVFHLDTSSLQSVRHFASTVKDHFTHIHYLINNAGLMYAPYALSEDGYESQFATNYLGHFLLTHLLLSELIRGGTSDENARVVNVSSCAYLRGSIDFDDINKENLYIRFEAYAQSKLAQIYFTTYLNRLLQEHHFHVQSHAVHPGIVNTDLFNETYLKKYFWWTMKFLKTPAQGAYPIVYATISPKLERLGGNYISNCKVQNLTCVAKDASVEERLFNFTNDLLGIETFGQA